MEIKREGYMQNAAAGNLRFHSRFESIGVWCVRWRFIPNGNTL